MRTEQVEIFKFDELSDAAKENARNWWREANAGDMPWSDEWRDSLKSFQEEFGSTIRDWSVDTYSYDFTAAIENEHVRGRKLSEFGRDRMPTGFRGDCPLWETLHDQWKRTGDAKYAIDAALTAFFREWRDDMADAVSDESVDESITINEYEFTADGKRY